MEIAEEDFDLAGHHFRAGAFVIPNADRAALEPQLQRPGPFGVGGRLGARGEDARIHMPRIGYVHSWPRTQDEGWVRAALDHYSVPYTYFADKKLREGNLRAKYDVIIFPHVGGTTQIHARGHRRNGQDTAAI